jgi:hypothetical protein
MRSDFVCIRCGSSRLDIFSPVHWDIIRQDFVVDEKFVREKDHRCMACDKWMRPEFKPVMPKEE